MNKRLFPLVQAAMIAAALIGGNAASIVSAEDAPVIPQETALTDSAEPDTPEPESAPDEPAETPEEPEAPAEPEIVEFAAEPEEAALEALMSAPESEPIEPEIVQAAAETLSAMPTARKAAALKAMRPVTYVPEGLPEGVTLSVDVPPAAFSEPVEIYARFLTDPEDGSFSEDIIAAAQAQYEEALAACEEGYSAGVMLFDLSFVNEAGEEVEPALPVSVSMAFSEVSEGVEITGVRHFTDTENVDAFDDLEFASENSEELTLNYITESCSPFTVTWTHPTPNKKLNVYVIDDEGNEISGYSHNDVNRDKNGIWTVEPTNQITVAGQRYYFEGVTTSPVPPQNMDDYLDCKYIQYYEHESGGIDTGWYFSYSNSQGWGLGWFLHYLEYYHSFPNVDATADSLDLYIVYYPAPFPVDLHLCIRDSATEGSYIERESTTINVGSSYVYLRNQNYASTYNGQDGAQLYICTDPNNPVGTRITGTNNLRIRTNTSEHPKRDYYYVWVLPNYIPAPTGVTQKAAPYAAMVILAAVSAAVMIKRRKGGDVDETSPL